VLRGERGVERGERGRGEKGEEEWRVLVCGNDKQRGGQRDRQRARVCAREKEGESRQSEPPRCRQGASHNANL
jgi:hypothetical protein